MRLVVVGKDFLGKQIGSSSTSLGSSEKSLDDSEYVTEEKSERLLRKIG